MVTGTIWSVSTTNLLSYFREAMIAMVPIANKVKMPWREPENYDDWDRIAAALYGSIVTRSFENATEARSLLPMAHYDERIDSYANKSFISTRQLNFGAAFICFETDKTPFDKCLFACLNETGRVMSHTRLDFQDVTFAIVSQNETSVVRLTDLNVVL